MFGVASLFVSQLIRKLAHSISSWLVGSGSNSRIVAIILSHHGCFFVDEGDVLYVRVRVPVRASPLRQYGRTHPATYSAMHIHMYIHEIYINIAVNNLFSEEQDSSNNSTHVCSLGSNIIAQLSQICC
jgi:hypothetical protein